MLTTVVWSLGLADCLALGCSIENAVFDALRQVVVEGVELDSSLLAACLVFLVPAGLTMIATGASSSKTAASVAAVGLIAVALGVVVFCVIGFGLQFGGLGLISNLEGASGLRSEWSPVDVMWGPGWGLVGLDGFLVIRDSPGAGVLAVVLYYSALAATAVCIPLLALARRLRFLPLLGSGLIFAAFVFPIYGNWVWGGGYLAQLGKTAGWGHGFVDFAGAGTIHALGGSFALAAILALGAKAQDADAVSEPEPPPVHFPLVALLGAFLLLPGWFGVVLGNPLVSSDVSYVRIVLNVLLAGCGGVLVSALYVWFVRGGPDMLMICRGLVASLVAVSASCAFVTAWAALVIGSIAGLLLPLSIYLFEARLRLDDYTSAAATHGISGLWGLIAVGVLADGSAGLGWNDVGPTQYLGMDGQGVSGLLVRSGFTPDWPAQLYAQLVGILALLLFSLGLCWLVFYTLNSLWARVVEVRSEVRGSRGGGST
jgi:Amt family ammonium transporter